MSWYAVTVVVRATGDRSTVTCVAPSGQEAQQKVEKLARGGDVTNVQAKESWK